MKNAETLITAHFTSGDSLSKLQDRPFYAIGPLSFLSSAAGTRNNIGKGGHSIVDMCETLGTHC